jgi:DNA-binding transcriptional ArsR family regulator
LLVIEIFAIFSTTPVTAVFEIAKLSQIRALASPVRQAIVDALEAAGPCSVAELAGLLGRRPDRLYYHVRILVRHGLVEADERRSGSGRAEAVYDLPGRPTRLRYAPEERGNATAVTKVVASMLRSALRSFRRSLRPNAVVAGPQREVWASRRTVWLTPAELAEVNQHLERLLALTGGGKRPRDDAALFGVTFVLAPAAPARASARSGRARRVASASDPKPRREV